MTAGSGSAAAQKLGIVLVAAGRGARAGDGPPKQFRLLKGRPVLAWAAEAALRAPDAASLVIVSPPGGALAVEAALADLPKSLLEKIASPCEGGADRQASVLAGLEALAGDPPSAVLIHDAARPFLPAAVAERALEALSAADGACAALPLTDTLRRAEPPQAGAGAAPLCGETIPRDGLWRAQTPQAFRFASILNAHRAADAASRADPAAPRYTDDADLARAAGLRVALTLGDERLAKITRPEDFAAAERVARVWAEGGVASGGAADVRVGHGYDVHKFGENADGSSDHVMLCGLRVPHDAGLVGHSDADVGLHALTDAVLSAGALGDIGRHFPPSDPQWRGAESDQFLAHAVRLLAEAGGVLRHLDATLVCERPKIGPHAEAMRARIADITGLAVERVSVKATTSEGLGFTGRREGIAALATATAVF